VADPDFVSLANIPAQRLVLKEDPVPIIDDESDDDDSILLFDDISDDESEFDDSDSEDEDENGDLRLALGPDAPPNELVTEKRYKWSIKAADAYIWNLGAAGAAPMPVDFGQAAPPSAPKLEAKEENMRRRTQRISMRWSQKQLSEEEAAAALAGIRARNADRQKRREAKALASEERKKARAEARAEARQAQIEERPRKRAANRNAAVSTRISTAIHHAVVPRYLAPEDRLDPFEEDEMQPGDLDYEYTMCLMRWFPCLRPKEAVPRADKNAMRRGSPEMQKMSRDNGASASTLSYYNTTSSAMSGSAPNSSFNTIAKAQGQSGNPRFNTVDEDEERDSVAPMSSYMSQASLGGASASMASSTFSMGGDEQSSYMSASQPSMLSSASSY
jgi:hypothetical protein